VDISDITQRESFFTAEETPLLFISGETLVARHKLIYPPISGTTAKFEMSETPLAAPKSKELIEILVAVFPVVAVITAKTGMNAVINAAQVFIAVTAEVIAENTGEIIIPVTASVWVKDITVFTELF